MRVLVQSLIDSLPEFVNLGIFIVFIFVLFATIGLQQYAGEFWNECRLTPSPDFNKNEWPIDQTCTRACSLNGMGQFSCPQKDTCGNIADYPELTLESDNVDTKPYLSYGIINFDNFGTSLLTVFQMITSETFYQQQFNMMDVDIPLVGALYSISIIIVGKFYLLNLILAVIINSFMKLHEKQLKEEVELIEEGIYSESNVQEDGPLAVENTENSKVASEEEQVVTDSVSSENIDSRLKNLKQAKNVKNEQYHRSRTVQSSSVKIINVEDRKDKPPFWRYMTKNKYQKRQFPTIVKTLRTSSISKSKSKQQRLKTNSSFHLSLGNTDRNPQRVSKKLTNEYIVESIVHQLPEKFPSPQNKFFKRKIKDLNDSRFIWNIIESGRIDQNRRRMTYQKYFKNQLIPQNSQGDRRKTIIRRIQKEIKSPQIADEKGTKYPEQKNKLRPIEILTLLRKNLSYQVSKQSQHFTEQQSQQIVRVNQRISGNMCYRIALQVQQSPFFTIFNFLVVVANIVVLSIDTYPINLQRTINAEIWNLTFTVLYTAEILTNLLAYGFKIYFTSSIASVYDCSIVVLSIVDVFLAKFYISNLTNGSTITVLRALRALRVFKLAKYWRNFRILLETLWMTVVNTSTFMCFLFLIMFIYILLGVEFFANKAKFNPSTNEVDILNGKSPLLNFDTLFESFTTTFVILTNDGQSAIYYNYYRAVSGPLSTVFWLTFVMLVQKILFNVFLAILLQNYNEGTLKHQILEKEKHNGNLQMQLREYFSMVWSNVKMKFIKTEAKKSQEDREVTKKQSMLSDNKVSEKVINIPDFKGKSLGFIQEDSSIRKFLHKLLSHEYYRHFIIIVIIISTTQLALDSSTLDPNSSLYTVLYWIDLSVVIIFSLEAAAKIITYGLMYAGENSYFRGSWNILDFVILIFSFICLMPLVSSFKVVKALRILRSLRLISRNEGLKVAVRAVFSVIPKIINITIIMLIIFLIFAIVSVSYFKGKFYACEGQISSDVISKWDCMNLGGLWQNNAQNFDNVLNALVNLFVMATTTGWSEIMMKAASSTDIDYVENSNQKDAAWIIFFIVFMIVGYFFFLNLFVCVVINTFNAEQMRVGGSKLLTEKQQEWIDQRLLVQRSAPIQLLKPPENRVRKVFFRIFCYRNFEKFIQISIILNAIVLMVKWYRQPAIVDQVTEYIIEVFTMIFMSEALVRILAIGVRPYFLDGWNKFDFIVAFGSVVGFVISLNTPLQPKTTTVFRAFRILRLLRLLRRGGKSLHQIFNTFVITLQSLINIGGLLILIMYIYSIVGLIYMGDIKRTGIMNDYFNFETFTSSFNTLFIVSTGDSWNLIMAALSNGKSPSNDCVNNPSYVDYQQNYYQAVGCGDRGFAQAFFISFTFIASLVFIKLLIAIILQGYLQTQSQQGKMFNNDIREKFKQVWSDFDPEATCFIKLSDLRPFLFALGAPLGFDQSYNVSKFLQDRFIASLELPTYHDFSSYQFLDILDALSFRLMVIDHIAKLEQEEQEIMQGLSSQEGIDEVGVKPKIQKKINRLIFQKQSENIEVFKELWEKEHRKKQNREKNKDQTGLTSSHHMALEATIRRIKVILEKKRQAREDEKMLQS